MVKAITRAGENELPNFGNYEEAKAFFTERYGSDFILQDIDRIGEQLCYFHALVLDWEEYDRGQKQLREQGSLTGFEYIGSYQPIQIMEDGSLHIVY